MARLRIRPAAVVAGRAKPKRPRVYEGHSRRWQYGMRSERPGEQVQMNHMSVSFPRHHGEELHRRVSDHRLPGRLALSRATSHNAARFLEHVIDTMPFAITAIQVDGGNEFRGAFEHAHRTLREEFYGQYRHEWNLQTLNPVLDAFQHHYCHYRPHAGKGPNFRTPMAYYLTLVDAA